MALTKEQIERIDDLSAKLVEVDVPEWGGSVFLRPMTVGELDAFANESMRKRETGVDNFRSKVVACCLCDAKGDRLFSDAEVAVLAAKSGPVIARLYEMADKLNDITPPRVEQVAGKSDAGQTAPESSGFASPAT